MKILVTGAKGFLGKNLIAELKNRGYRELLCYDCDSDPSLLDIFTAECEFVFHLAGVNRPKDTNEFIQGNFEFTSRLIDCLKRNKNKAPIVVSSSIQAVKDNPYGASKKAGEDALFDYAADSGAKVMIYRLQNVFGKWSRPNYNSVVATFCNNIAHSLPIQINDLEAKLNLIYIDDVVNEFIRALEGKANYFGNFCRVEPVYEVTLGELSKRIYSFKESRENLFIPDFSDDFTKKLYSTYLSYLPQDEFSYQLTPHTDHRGSFTEFIKTSDFGQVSVNVSVPGVTKGNHWHHTKNEKFLVVSGSGIIQFRRVGDENVISYPVRSDRLTVVDIPCGYTHSITNTGDGDLVTIMWASEPFDKDNPDTYYMEV
ncbi:MAG: capsular polysaccharide biosynthesis protein CapF [Bacillota bacterium]|nr:capsular polysaccharide biosynthesis protein CapF [Bacillota bacterium]